MSALAWVGVASADIYHLRTGGRISGDLLERDAENYRLRTKVGVVSIKISNVERVEAAPTPLAEYDRRAAEAGPDAKAQAALARWCAANDLPTEARRHWEATVAAEPDHAEARAALGQVKVGDAWERPQPASQPTTAPAPDESAPDADAQLETLEEYEAAQNRYRLQVRAIRQNMLESTLPRLWNDGVKRILEMRDPRAIYGLSHELSAGPPRQRELLLRVLSSFAEDEATLNLAALVLMEPEPELRALALEELARRDDPRVVNQFRAALHSDADWVVANAAQGLGGLRAESAVPELIGALTVERHKWIEVTVPQYFSRMSAYFPPQRFRGGATAHPHIGVFDGGSGLSLLTTEIQRRNVTVMRTEVLEALKRITGANLGFNRQDWIDWYRAEWRPAHQEQDDAGD